MEQRYAGTAIAYVEIGAIAALTRLLPRSLEALRCLKLLAHIANRDKSEGPRLDADLMFEEVFKEIPEHLQKQRILMRSERDRSGRG